MEAGSALVGKWAAHEGREQALANGDLLHRCLEHERAVGRVERLRVLDVDLVLGVHELVVRGERLQPEVVAPEQHLEHDLARIRDGPDRVDAGELVDVAAKAVLRRGVALGEEELELRGDDRRQAPRGVLVDDPAQQRSRARRPVLGAVERPGLAEAPGNLRLPRHGAQRVEVGLDREVDVAHLAADDRRVAEVGPHDGRAEGDALLAHAFEVPDRDVLAARDAVQIGVEQPNRADAEPAHRPDGCLGLVVLTQLRASLVLRSAPAPAGA